MDKTNENANAYVKRVSFKTCYAYNAIDILSINLDIRRGTA